MRRAAALLIAGLLWPAAPLPAIEAKAPPAASAAGEAGESTLRRADLRVAKVAYRLALAGRPLCPGAWPLTGMLFHHLAEYEVKDRPLMVARYGLDRGPGVLSVIAGSPAARAGLVAGDVFLAVNGAVFPSPSEIAGIRERTVWRRRLEATERQLEDALRQGPAELLVLRGGSELRLRLDSLPACLGRIRLARSDQTNAFATGTYVVMTTSMLDYVRNDDELAVVLGHEMAHDILGHPATRSEEGVLAGLGIHASNIWKREADADRFGLRLMAAAGYDLDAAIPFWRRYLGKFDWFPQIFRSHPSLGARERIAADEIAAIRAGQPWRAGI
ncbi:MAG: M48 family metalloprotease [Alphaproteobacteria bacterium]|nr:M48 family metalloprotease [Alphaproteobacteria bacterium]